MARVRGLPKEEQAQRDKIRYQATNYAKQFLVQKYRDEYHELYSAYLRNRGIETEVRGRLVDERQVNA